MCREKTWSAYVSAAWSLSVSLSWSLRNGKAEDVDVDVGCCCAGKDGSSEICRRVSDSCFSVAATFDLSVWTGVDVFASLLFWVLGVVVASGER